MGFNGWGTSYRNSLVFKPVEVSETPVGSSAKPLCIGSNPIDKPAEHVQIAGAEGGPIVISWQRDESEAIESGSNVIEIPAIDVKQIESHEPDTSDPNRQSRIPEKQSTTQALLDRRDKEPS